ncbi:unnamed protein product [Didymodactylos carnosus]|uniref:Dienelactone hydrolase domain-containing protein n=1 Tax=Didymodactylos carnosus TaxID=1234261 RepID=A0A8S2JH11_9BILA|nr:unnamed protein product [Didymodactylos carnosus]CAF3809101.1 unnamed protein product [Didymodactylos carnosus]
MVGLPVYIATNNTTTSTDKIIVVMTDVFGWELKNIRLLADEYASNGFYVLVPDFFKGDPVPLELEAKLAPPSAPKRNFFTAVSDTFSAATTVGPWLIRHRESVSKPIVDSFFIGLRQQYPSSKIGAVGFCWGGRYAILLTHTDAKVQVDAAVAIHPSLLSIPSEIEKIAKPVSFAVGDKDQYMSVKQADQTRLILSKKTNVDGEVEVYPGMVHGFGCRGDLTIEENKKGHDRAMKQTIDWFKKYL